MTKLSDHVKNSLAPGNYRKLGRLTGVSHQHIARVLRGECGVTLATSTRLAHAADITLDELAAYITQTPGLRIWGIRKRADAQLRNEIRDERLRHRKRTHAVNHPTKPPSRRAAQI